MPAAPKSSLEILLDTLRERDEQRQDDGDPFLPPTPARPRGRGRPPTTARRPLPSVFKVENGEGTARTEHVDRKPDVGKEGVTISDDCAAGVIHPVIETVLGDAVSPPEEEQRARALGRGVVAGQMLSPQGMDKVVQDYEDDNAMWINHGAAHIVDGVQQHDSETTEINKEESLHDAMIPVPRGDSNTDTCTVSPSASPSSAARVGRRTPSQRSSSCGSSRESEPDKPAKAKVGKLLWGSISCVRAPVAAVARMVLNSCGSRSARARAVLEEQSDLGAERILHRATMRSVRGGGGDTDVGAVKASAAPSVSRSGGVVWRWLRKVTCRPRRDKDVEETTQLRQRNSLSTPQPQIVPCAS